MRVVAHFPQVSQSLPTATAEGWETPVFVLAVQPAAVHSTASTAWPLILRQNLQFSSAITFLSRHQYSSHLSSGKQLLGGLSVLRICLS